MKYYTTRETAAILGVHMETVRRLLKKKRFPHALHRNDDPRLDWHIPEDDILAHAEKEGPWKAEEVRRKLGLPDEDESSHQDRLAS